MKLSEASYKILQPLVYTSRIFAICPVTINKIGNYYHIKYSKLLVVYSYTFVIVFGIGTVLGVINDIAEGKNAIRMKSKKTRYISICDMFVVLNIALYGIISIPYRMRNFVKMVDIWSHVDSIIPLSNPQKYRKISIIFLTTTILVTTLLLLFDIFIYCLQWRVSNDPTFYLQLYASYYIIYYVFVFQEIFFWHMVFFIHIRILTLNENLIIEKRKLNNVMKKLFVIPYSLNNSSNGKEDSGEVKAKASGKNSFSSQNGKFGKNTAERIEELLKIYGKIRESVELLNSSASFGIVQIMLSCLLHLVVTPYFLLMGIFKSNASTAFILLQGVWFLAHTGRLLIMVEPCQRCINELKKFASMFSHADISFNACGFFTINRNMLTTISGAVSTYLVILFQFQENEPT